MENVITNSVHTSKIETSRVRVCTVLEEPGEVHAQEAAECHQEEGNLTKYQLEVHICMWCALYVACRNIVRGVFT